MPGLDRKIFLDVQPKFSLMLGLVPFKLYFVGLARTVGNLPCVHEEIEPNWIG